VRGDDEFVHREDILTPSFAGMTIKMIAVLNYPNGSEH